LELSIYGPRFSSENAQEEMVLVRLFRILAGVA
jgi:hypothetical protein